MKDDLERLLAELSRIGLLLEHDQRLPSATALLAGEPIRGSWWGPPHGQRIYAVLEAFSEREGALCVKLVNSKRTYVHRSLWPALLTLAQERESERSRALSPLAQQLREQVLRDGEARADALVASNFAKAGELNRAGAELEVALLVHVDSIHTPSGAHTKVFRAWPAWGKAHAVLDRASTPEQCREELRAAVERLGAGAAGQSRLKVAILE
jgi:hypothetical protein